MSDMKRYIYIFLIIVGFIYLVGTVGAADQELISITRLVIQSLVSIVCMSIGGFGIYLEEQRETYRWDQKSNSNNR